ncbi:MAG: TonB-dependent receptor [Bacteroidota bacterium]|nr:TonB-dependent receptor [Bacteroidota bacterium]
MKSKNIFSQLLLWILFLGISGFASGQGRVISGLVTDKDGQAIPGVAIMIKSTTSGTTSDISGHYSITVPSSESVLVFSFIGYLNETVPVGDRTTINITLTPSVQNLEEIVVVGYGTLKKKDITSSLVSVKGSDLSKETQGNFTAALQGKAAGVQVITNSGAPGAVPTVLIRGFTTINLSTSPLYVVDGIPMVSTDGNSNVNFVNSDEIETIEVLKDASAAAIYGTRASNGVILITTKRGKVGKTKYDFNFTYGVQTFKKPYNVLNSDNYAKAMNLSYENSNLSDLITDTQSLNNTDWWGAGIRKISPEFNTSLNISGGTEKHRYNIGLSYFKQESFYHEGDWNKFTARINNDIKLANWITVGLDLNPRREYWNNTPSWYGDYLLIDPITPVMRPADQLTGTENEYSKYMRSIYTYVWNPRGRDSRQSGNNGSTYALYSNSYIDIHPLKNLTFKTQAGVTYEGVTYNSFNPQFTIDASHEFNSTTSISRQKNTNVNWTWQNTLTYNWTLQKHSGSVMAGMTSEEQNQDYIKGYRQGFPNTTENMRELDASNGTVQTANGNTYRNSIESYLGRVTYNYDNRFLMTATARRDGSSKFMDKNKWAFFPSGSVAWHLSNEKFLKDNKVVSDAKLFAGWGTVGNQGIPSDVYLSKLGTNYYIFNGAVTSVTTLSSMKNEDIKWETIEEKNLGLDVKLFNSALTATVEGFQKTTHNMLFQMNYPYYSGYPSSANIWTNIGKMQATGMDLALGYMHETNKMKLNVGATLSTSKMKMKTLPGVPELLGGPGWNSVSTTRMVVGDEPGYFYGYKTDGIFQNKTEINSHTSNNGDILQPYARPGDVRFVDVNKDGVIDSKDRVKLGSPYPKFTGGFSLNAVYKTNAGDFDLGMNIYFSYGNKIVNWLTNDKYNAVGQTNLASDALDKAWHGEGTSTKIPILSHNDLNENYTKFSDLYVEDGSFIRLKDIQLGYSLPKKVISRLKLSNLRFFISAQNILTLTKFSGVDPETSFSPMSYGFQEYSYPVLKTCFFGINLSF